MYLKKLLSNLAVSKKDQSVPKLPDIDTLFVFVAFIGVK